MIFLLIGLRPLLGSTHCYYEPSCGNYALEQLKQKPFYGAFGAIVKRLICCNPLLYHHR